jgi:hypothetical protein
MGKEKKTVLGKTIKVCLGVTLATGFVVGIGAIIVGSVVTKKTAKAVRHSVDNVKKEAQSFVNNENHSASN